MLSSGLPDLDSAIEPQQTADYTDDIAVPGR